MFALALSFTTVAVIVLAAILAYGLVSAFFAKKRKVDELQEVVNGAAAVFDNWQFDRVASIVRSIAVTNFLGARKKLQALYEDYTHAPDKDECVLGWLWPSFVYQLPKRLDPKRALFRAECEAVVKAVLDCPEARAEVLKQIGQQPSAT